MSIYRQTARVCGRILINHLNKTQITDSRNIKRWVAPTLKELYRRQIKAGSQPETSRSKFLEWNYEAEVFAFGKRLGEDFDKNLLKRALTHSSYVNLQADKAKEQGVENFELESNAALIEEGGAIISPYLRDTFSTKYPEDVVKAFHDYLTSEKMLSHVATHMGLKDIILTSEFPVENATLANTFKAVVAALKNSQGLDRAHLFIKDFLVCYLHDKEIFDLWDVEQPFEYLEKLLAEKGIQEIEPRLCNQSGISTLLANYQVGLYNNKKLLGIGWGESIEIAKNTAALDAIQKLYNLNNQLLK